MIITEPETVDVPTPAGPMRMAIYRPAGDGSHPGLVFFSEIYQITAPIRRTAAFLAGHGFVVAIPEVYHEHLPPGTVLEYDAAGTETGNALKTTKVLGSYDADARAAIDHLASRPDCTGRLGTIGICLGGHLAFRCAMNASVLAGACFYATDIHERSLGQSMRDDTLDRMGEIEGEMLMVWGRQDPHIPRDGRRIIYDAMSDAGIDFTWHEFNGQHAFVRDEGHRYDAELARTCYGLAIDLFRRRLAT